MPRLLSLCLTLVVCSLVAQGQTPKPCQPPALQANLQESNLFTEQQESDLGDAIAEHIQRNIHVIDDEDVTANLIRIGQRIVRHIPATNLRFQFLLVDLPDANAFVLPGGRVYVSRKLVALAHTEDEVAGVIGHEIGHLLARQQSIRMSRLMREVLGVTEVKDRKDIFEKYNQLMENFARKPKAFARGDSREDDQVVADQIGLFAAAAAGYDPAANAQFFDRITENKGKTGSFFSDLFGTTRPEARRVREMIKLAGTLPASCIEARESVSGETFKQWQASVVNYTGLGRREALHSVVKKLSLDPPLRGEINHLRFSPDGKFVLAQDDSGISVLSVEPFAAVFRIEAPEAKPAQFSPDSQDIILYNSSLRLEIWSIADQKLKEAKELFLGRKRCLQTSLSPDGKILACLDTERNLSLTDVSAGSQIFQKKEFFTPSILELLLLNLSSILNDSDDDDSDYEWINMGFSPDGRYFAAGAHSLNYTAVGSIVTEVNGVAIDLTTKESVPLRGPIKKLLSGGFAFVGPDRLVGIDRQDPRKSLMVAFPGGETVDQIPLGNSRIASPARGKYLLIRPISNYPLGVLDLSTKKIFMANKQSAFDIYDNRFVSERTNGEVGLYGIEKNDMQAKVVLPRNSLGRLRVVTLSPDFQWLAVSERTRGAIWNLEKGRRDYLVRGFRGGHFGDDLAFYADFPKLEPVERSVTRFDLTKRDVVTGPEITETRATQYGPFLLTTKPTKKDGGYNQNVTINLSDARTSSSLWSRQFPKEAPRVWVNPQEETMVLSWPVSSSAAQSEIKADSALSKQLASMKEKEGDYFLEVLDARTSKIKGHLLIETGKGSFRISNVFAAGDWVVISDTQNRTLVYSLKTGEEKGKFFGSKPAINVASQLLSVENESGRLILYDLSSMQERDKFVFSSPVSLARFSRDGKRMFVLTAQQVAYVLDVSAPQR